MRCSVFVQEASFMVIECQMRKGNATLVLIFLLCRCVQKNGALRMCVRRASVIPVVFDKSLQRDIAVLFGRARFALVAHGRQ